MVRHFKTKKEARDYKGESSTLRVFKKLKGHKNRIKKPYVVCSHIGWLNLY